MAFKPITHRVKFDSQDVLRYSHTEPVTLWLQVMQPLKEYSSLQENPYNVRYIHTVLIVHIYFAPWGVDNV